MNCRQHRLKADEHLSNECIMDAISTTQQIQHNKYIK